jgi:sigma-B regulation protein RsbU (phosphoserine phosphatase)
VADVSGHGAPAAIVMAMIRAVLHTYPGVPDDPSAVLNHLNRHFEYLWDTSMFATAIYGVVDAERRTLRVACAGHPPPFLVRPGNGVMTIPVDATLFLLMTELGNIPCTEHTLQPGDRVVFFTDGILERQATDEAMYDADRMKAVLNRNDSLEPIAIVAQVVADVETFAGGREPDDDQTLVVVGVK